MPAIEEWFEFLRFASISADSKSKGEIEACAAWVARRLKKAGLAAETHSTAGNPVVVGRSDRQPGRPTVLVYGHYDVQPPDPVELWTHPPFEPHLDNGIVTARGAADNKGQIFAHLLGAEAAIRSGEGLPCNLIFVIEGEEEVGSPNLAPFLRQHRADLACDVVLVSDSSMAGPGCPTLTYGLRGIAAMEIELTGPARDLHSGFFGGAVMNPLTAMCRLLATMHDAEMHVAIGGFYDGVRPIQDWEREAWSKLPQGDAGLQAISGAPALVPAPGFTAIEMVSGQPTAEINGLYGGYQGEGSKTVIPSRAVAKLSFRLVAGQTPEDVLAKVERHFHAHLPLGVTLKVTQGHGGAPYFTDPHSRFGKAAIEALRSVFDGREPYLVREGGTIPVVADFKNILGADTLLLGLALPGCNMHSPNETFPLAHLDLGARLHLEVLRRIAAT
jgi:acetylornithine deacetylase/succinyl-diaminopimelate desuccinylase-like protein